MPSVLAISVLAFLITALGRPAEIPHPTQGHEQGVPSNGWEIIFPLSIVQCEPVLIYYNNTLDVNVYVALAPPDDINGINSQYLLVLSIPKGVGYLDWICNIPAGYTFFTFPVAGTSGGFNQLYTVQPGSSAACLGDITTTYSYANYSTANFQSYTQSPAGIYSSLYEIGTVTIPTGSFPTITVNPDLAATLATSFSASPSSASLHNSPSPATSSAVSSTSTAPPSPTGPPPPASSHKPNRTGAIVGGTVGGLILVAGFFVARSKAIRRGQGVCPLARLAILLQPLSQNCCTT